MATAIDPGDLLRVRIWFQSGDQAAVNTVYYVCATVSGNPTTDLNVAQQMDAFVAPSYKVLIADTATYRGVQVSIVRTPPRATQQAFAQAGVGTAGAVGMPRQVSGLLKFNTTDAGRAFRGRLYIPFPATASAATDGLPSSTYLTDLASLASLYQSIGSFDNDLVTPTGFITVAQVIVHTVPKGGVPPPPAPSPVIAWTPAEVFATQRRRGSFGRPNVSPV